MAGILHCCSLIKKTNGRNPTKHPTLHYYMKVPTTDVCTTISMMMGIKRIVQQGITHPFGDARSVKQAFPANLGTKDADPFLMCDYFDMKETKGQASHDDEFPVDWHPHRGFDIATYLRTGVGRHADSLGNRETFPTPGMQWMSVGSGVEHAEGGGNDKGVLVQGFQIWINVPGDRKMDDPRYGTVPPSDMPLVDFGGAASARVLAGEALGVKGPFETVQPVQMIDFELKANAKVSFDIAIGLDTALLYVYEGSLASVNQGTKDGSADAGHVIVLDADSEEQRGLELQASSDQGANVMLFAGKKLKEPIAWHGPIVMNTQFQIEQTFREMRSGKFPPKRVNWDYKDIAAFPKT
jgi:quercetin 2,3-dioxygenase